MCILLFAALYNLAWAADITVGIRLVEQKIYFLNDDIDIKITLENSSVDTQQFRIADNRAFSFDFDVRTALNRMTNFHSDSFENNRNSLKPILYRDLSLAPGEEYSLVVRFKDFVTLNNPGLYVVQVRFYPDLFLSGDSSSLQSNTLTLNIRPATSSPAEKAAVEIQLDRAAERGDLPPDKVVIYTLKAREEGNWSKFFLYINLEALYINSALRTSPNGRDQFNRLSESEKKAKIDSYRKQIMALKSEGDLVLLASSFSVQKTSYTATDASVQVRQVYNHPDYQEVRTYRYTLRRNNGIWEIVSYQVENLNSGAR
ncbi:MAG: hypothetical protein JXD23_08510 [Spirochaetales bacterium]|nr:hypothetical protein [Spirochaetales bacterium]